MALIPTGSVASEGGPLLVADLAEATRCWSGAFADGSDYQRAIAPLDVDPLKRGFEIEVGKACAIVWDVPAGVTAVSSDATGALQLDAAGRHRRDMSNGHLGELDVLSGWIVVAWSAEDLTVLGDFVPSHGAELSLSVGHGGLVVRASAGRYEVQHAEYSDGVPHQTLSLRLGYLRSGSAR